jgi:hypothetical protein
MQRQLATHRWVDGSRAPLYVLTYPRERELSDMLAAHDTVEDVYRRTQGPIGWIVDATLVSGATAKERQIVVAHERRTGDAAAARCAGLALVIPNALVRGFYTAIRWVEPARYPCESFSTFEGAEAWVRAQLTAALR